MIHYDTVNKILDLTRKFDKENMDVNELTAKMENILLSDGWKLKIANEPVVMKSVCVYHGCNKFSIGQGFCVEHQKLQK